MPRASSSSRSGAAREGPGAWLLRRCLLCWLAPLAFLLLAPGLVQELRANPPAESQDLDTLGVVMGPLALLLAASLLGAAGAAVCGRAGEWWLPGMQLMVQILIICYFLGLLPDFTGSAVVEPSSEQQAKASSDSQGLPRAVLNDAVPRQQAEPQPVAPAPPPPPPQQQPAAARRFLAPQRKPQITGRISVVLPCLNEPYARKTVESFCNRTPQDVLEEILVVDDASQPPIEEKLRGVDPKCRMRVLRHKESLGLMIAKQTGGDAATGKYIGFYDCHVAPATNWYKETIHLLEAKSRRLVVPMIADLDLDAWDEKPHGALTAKCYINFNADFWWYDDESDFIPVISGGLVATTREWWAESGGFDPGMHGWGGENTDQSLRAWLCGGDVVRAKSSHVAHMWRTDSDPRTLSKYHLPHKTDNLARVAALWFGDFKDKFRDGSLDRNIDVSAAKSRMEALQCKPFVYFLHRFRKIHVGGGMLPEKVFKIRSKRSLNCITKAGSNYRISPCGSASWFHLANMVPPNFPSLEELGVTAGEEKASEPEDKVTCGGHVAPSCAQCPQGHGEEWCHMDCAWVFGNCIRRSKDLGHSQKPRLGQDFSGIRSWNTMECWDRLDPSGPIAYFCDLTGGNFNQQYVFDGSGRIRHHSGSCVDDAQGTALKAANDCTAATEWEKIDSFVPSETTTYKDAVRRYGLTDDLPDS